MRILFVDDEHMMLETFTNYMETQLGHQVTPCDNGQEAYEEFVRNPFPMVLSDIRMPGWDGIKLLKKLKSHPQGKTADIVLVTGYGDVESTIAALRGGAYDYLLKPVDLVELETLIDRIAEHQSLLQENLEFRHHFEERVADASKEFRLKLKKLEKAYAEITGTGNIGIFSEPMQKAVELAGRFHKAPSIPVLIEGETGTGKEVIARLIHHGDFDTVKPFVSINCSAIPEHLFESELFGYEGGAFSGAKQKGSAGKLELASDGTIFLDEIGDMPLVLQPKLLRILEEREYYRLGGLRKYKFTARIVCASNCNLAAMVKENKFRRDLYYRLNVGRISLPALREVPETVQPMAQLFLDQISKQKRSRFKSISKDALQMLKNYKWPGNIRELKNTIERVVIMYDDTQVKPVHLRFLDSDLLGTEDGPGHRGTCLDLESQALPPDSLRLEDVEKSIIHKALTKYKGNKSRTAVYLGISRGVLERKIKKYF